MIRGRERAIVSELGRGKRLFLYQSKYIESIIMSPLARQF